MQKNANIDLRKYRVIYLTPEYLDGKSGREKLETIKEKICLVAIDECHCITQWGASFRPKYRKLFEVRTLFPNVPIISLTATATQHCVQDVCASLKLKNPLIIRAELNRPNLQLFVFNRSGNFIDDVKKHVAKVDIGAVIIYVLKRKDSENYSADLNREGFQSRAYHAGMKDKERHEVLKEFAEGKLRLIVATIAFGMGIDRADVRLVIHYGTPRNVESYLQESGRAGRDGAPSKCIIFWEEQDFDFYLYWLRQNNKGPEYTEHCKRLLDLMKEYLVTENCRRMKILHYFDSSMPELPIHEMCCDNCINVLHKSVPLNEMYRNVDSQNRIDISTDVRRLLRLVKAYKGNCSLGSLKSIVYGFPVTCNQNHPLELFSQRKLKQEAWWIKMLQNLWIKGLVGTRNRSLEAANDLRVTSKGMKLLRRTSRKMTLNAEKDLLEFLDKTNTEFYIEEGELKTKPRQRVKKVVKDKIESSQKLFDFNLSSAKKLPENLTDDEDILELLPSTSTSDPVINEDENSEDENDYYLENTKLNFEMSRQPLKVELDDFLKFLENYDESFSHQPELESSMKKVEDVKRSQKAELDIDMSRVDLVANCSLKVALKRLEEYYEDEEEVPLKVARYSQET